MTRKLWLVLILVVCGAAWWTQRSLKSGVRFGDVVAYNVLFFTVLMEGALWGFSWWWHQPERNPYQRHLAEMRAQIELDSKAKAQGKRIQTRGF